MSRIKELRNELNLTQTAFGERIGVAKTTVAGWESGARIAPQVTIRTICQEFNVNYEWLVHGEGDMFVDLSENDLILDFVDRILSGSDPFLIDIFKSFAQLDTEDWKALEKFINIYIETKKK